MALFRAHYGILHVFAVRDCVQLKYAMVAALRETLAAEKVTCDLAMMEHGKQYVPSEVDGS